MKEDFKQSSDMEISSYVLDTSDRSHRMLLFYFVEHLLQVEHGSCTPQGLLLMGLSVDRALPFCPSHSYERKAKRQSFLVEALSGSEKRKKTLKNTSFPISAFRFSLADSFGVSLGRGRQCPCAPCAPCARAGAK